MKLIASKSSKKTASPDTKISKQHATSDTCTMNEEEGVLGFTEERRLITLGWVSVGFHLLFLFFLLVLPRLQKSSHDSRGRLETVFDSTRLDLVRSKSLEVDLSRLESMESRVSQISIPGLLTMQRGSI
ncbi:hypothetical protein B0H13DRAFT_1031854 [Mycena leptocephala]|nr:hypothetical protein B0H13DRAFT_1031854 [Mycena leptocephala]